MISLTGQRIRELRTEKGITQSELAELLDKTCSAPRMWELGKSMPDAGTICKLAAFFGCSSDYLLGISDFKTENEKVEYIDTERIFHKNLENLRGRDKICLINGLNHYITAYLAVENETGNGFEHIAALVHALSFMLEEIQSACERRVAKEEDKDLNASCEANAHGIITMGRQKLTAGDALEGIAKKLLCAYLDVIKGVCCSHSDDDDGAEESNPCES
jgi:transcriptional regulator with XRE-family HTH domain